MSRSTRPSERKRGRQHAPALHCSCCGAPLARRTLPDATPLCESCLLDTLSPPHLRRQTANGAFVEALAAVLDLREHEVGLHSRRVACHTLQLARRFFADDAARLDQIYFGALLHDLGKIGVPDRILLKQGPLDEDEWAVMRRHPEDGYRLVSQLPGMIEAADIVLCHEERFDGEGYPRRLRGPAIPFGARLFAVIDALDAITSDRPYRRGLPFDVAKAEILSMAGSQFDPVAVDAMVAEEAVLRRMVETKCAEAPPP